METVLLMRFFTRYMREDNSSGEQFDESRRKFLLATGAITTAAVAGCVGGDDDDGGDNGTSNGGDNGSLERRRQRRSGTAGNKRPCGDRWHRVRPLDERVLQPGRGRESAAGDGVGDAGPLRDVGGGEPGVHGELRVSGRPRPVGVTVSCPCEQRKRTAVIHAGLGLGAGQPGVPAATQRLRRRYRRLLSVRAGNRDAGR